MTQMKLDKEEKELLASYEGEVWQSVGQIEGKKNVIKDMLALPFGKIHG